MAETREAILLRFGIGVSIQSRSAPCWRLVTQSRTTRSSAVPSLVAETSQGDFSLRKKQTKPELVEPIGQPDWPDKLPVLLDHEVALQQLGAGQHLLGEQEVVVLGGKVTWYLVSGHNVKFEGSQPNQQTLDTGIF